MFHHNCLLEIERCYANLLTLIKQKLTLQTSESWNRLVAITNFDILRKLMHFHYIVLAETLTLNKK